ncbi:MAG: hypothetical protein KDN05_20880, partial [Verrucomicrobiae bacterium]|nr:hypothetical protein [Verrucomicrobiae bacterium]
MKTTRLLPLFVSASLLGTFGHGSAQILTWDPDPAAGIQNGSGIWSSTDANWTADGGATNGAWSDGSTAELTGGSKTLTLGGANAVDGITRTGTGETIIIGTATDTLAISGVVEADAFLTFRGNDPAAMSGSFEKTGGGQLAMQNTAFNFSSITLSAGTLTYYFTSPAPTTAFALNGGAVGSTTTTGRTFGGPVTIGGNVGIGSDTPSIDQAGAMIFNNTIDLTGGSRTITTGTGGTTFNGIVSNGSLVKEGGGSLFLTAANTLSSVTVNEGIVVGSNGIAFNGTQGGAFGPGAIT